MQLPHRSTAITEVYKDYVNDSRLAQWGKDYASMVKILDDDVGRICRKLEDLNILDNTIIVFKWVGNYDFINKLSEVVGEIQKRKKIRNILDEYLIWKRGKQKRL